MGSDVKPKKHFWPDFLIVTSNSPLTFHLVLLGHLLFSTQQQNKQELLSSGALLSVIGLSTGTIHACLNYKQTVPLSTKALESFITIVQNPLKYFLYSCPSAVHSFSNSCQIVTCHRSSGPTENHQSQTRSQNPASPFSCPSNCPAFRVK